VRREHQCAQPEAEKLRGALRGTQRGAEEGQAGWNLRAGMGLAGWLPLSLHMNDACYTMTNRLLTGKYDARYFTISNQIERHTFAAAAAN
jgi:hypothetical protein